jgi:hypothetical protein
MFKTNQSIYLVHNSILGKIFHRSIYRRVLYAAFPGLNISAGSHHAILGSMRNIERGKEEVNIETYKTSGKI